MPGLCRPGSPGLPAGRQRCPNPALEEVLAPGGGGFRMEPEAILLAVAAHIRHQETDYDELLAAGWERWEARDQVSSAVEQILAQWREHR
jgi:hypothetical protein